MLIAFASDYGLTDEFVGVCKAVMLGLAPDVRILDVGHEIPAHDVRAGALLLVRSVQYLPDDCIVVAVVDPGVGTSRRLVGVEVAGGVLLGPDNGLLAPAVAMAGGARAVISLDNPDYHLPAPGPTFAGRDVLAPAAGHLAAGVPFSELGSPVDPATLVPGLVALPEVRDDGSIVGEVWWVDRFGNCQLNIDPGELGAGGVGRAGRGARGRRDPCRSLGAHLRRRQAVGAGAAGRLLRAAGPGLRPRIGGGDATAEGRQRRHPRAGAPVRRGTTIMIVILLVLILGAAMAQFVLRLGP